MVGAAGGLLNGFVQFSFCHGGNQYMDSDAERTEALERMKHADQSRLAALEKKVDQLAGKLAAQHGVQELSGQGDMVMRLSESPTVNGNAPCPSAS